MRFVNSSKKRFCWQTIFLGMDWLFSAMISRGSLLRLHIWGHWPTHQLLPLVGDNLFICQEEWKRTCLLSFLCQTTCTNIPPTEQSPDLLCTWGSCLPTHKYASCRWLSLLLFFGAFAGWGTLKPKNQSENSPVTVKGCLISQRFNSYLRLCACFAFCLTVVRKAEFSWKGSRRRKEIMMPRFFKTDGTKGRIVETEQLFQI